MDLVLSRALFYWSGEGGIRVEQEETHLTILVRTVRSLSSLGDVKRPSSHPTSLIFGGCRGLNTSSNEEERHHSKCRRRWPRVMRPEAEKCGGYTNDLYIYEDLLYHSYLRIL